MWVLPGKSSAYTTSHTTEQEHASYDWSEMARYRAFIVSEPNSPFLRSFLHSNATSLLEHASMWDGSSSLMILRAHVIADLHSVASNRMGYDLQDALFGTWAQLCYGVEDYTGFRPFYRLQVHGNHVRMHTSARTHARTHGCRHGHTPARMHARTHADTSGC